ncbi:MAG: hypothetical protein QOF13_1257 [Solirubrobacterales bacterium]|jgi:hypothetical protein|nr:hypothetical protein [Solirubrobacterales bacterium]
MNPNAPVPHSKDSAVERQQLFTANSIFYLPPSQAHGDQLPPGDDAVLSLRQVPNRGRRLVGWRNALYARWTEKALHLWFEVFVLAWGHALPGR